MSHYGDCEAPRRGGGDVISTFKKFFFNQFVEIYDRHSKNTSRYKKFYLKFPTKWCNEFHYGECGAPKGVINWYWCLFNFTNRRPNLCHTRYYICIQIVQNVTLFSASLMFVLARYDLRHFSCTQTTSLKISRFLSCLRELTLSMTLFQL